MTFGIAGIFALGLIGTAWYATTSGFLGATGQTDEAEWIELFNGRDLTGWFKRVPNHGEWYVEDGAIRCKRDEAYGGLLNDKEFGPGVIRATIIPAPDGASLTHLYVSACWRAQHMRRAGPFEGPGSGGFTDAFGLARLFHVPVVLGR